MSKLNIVNFCKRSLDQFGRTVYEGEYSVDQPEVAQIIRISNYLFRSAESKKCFTSNSLTIHEFATNKIVVSYEISNEDNVKNLYVSFAENFPLANIKLYVMQGSALKEYEVGICVDVPEVGKALRQLNEVLCQQECLMIRNKLLNDTTIVDNMAEYVGTISTAVAGFFNHMSWKTRIYKKNSSNLDNRNIL